MSEIPFVNRLGDALEEAATAAPARERRRRRRPGRGRFGGLAVAIIVLGAAGVTVAEVLDDPEKLATRSISCYDRAALDGNVAVPGDDGRPPAQICAEVLRTSAPLVACVRAESIAVFPGPPETCERLRLRPVPEAYAAARTRVLRLSRALREVEDRADCTEPEELAKQADAVLAREGWRGWSAGVLPDDDGPCGWIHAPGGDARTSLSGALDANRRKLLVTGGPPRSLFRLLYGGKGSVSDRLFTITGDRCLTVEELQAQARDLLAGSGHEVRFTVDRRPQPEYEQIEPPERQRRYDEGCASLLDVAPVYLARDRIAIEVRIRIKPE